MSSEFPSTDQNAYEALIQKSRTVSAALLNPIGFQGLGHDEWSFSNGHTLWKRVISSPPNTDASIEDGGTTSKSIDAEMLVSEGVVTIQEISLKSYSHYNGTLFSMSSFQNHVVLFRIFMELFTLKKSVIKLFNRNYQNLKRKQITW